MRVNTSVELGQFVRERRLILHLSQTDIAKELGVTRQYISLVESGKACLIQSKKVSPEKLASVLGAPVTDLPEVKRKKRKQYKFSVRHERNEKTLGGYLTKLRLRQRKTQSWVAEQVGATQSYVSAIERGLRRPNRKMRIRWLRALGYNTPANV